MLNLYIKGALIAVFKLLQHTVQALLYNEMM